MKDLNNDNKIQLEMLCLESAGVLGGSCICGSLTRGYDPAFVVPVKEKCLKSGCTLYVFKIFTVVVIDPPQAGRRLFASYLEQF